MKVFYNNFKPNHILFVSHLMKEHHCSLQIVIRPIIFAFLEYWDFEGFDIMGCALWLPRNNKFPRNGKFHSLWEFWQS